MVYVLTFFGFMTVLGAIIAVIEARKAPLVSDKEPFLHDDYVGN